jgi:fructose-specific phosphotransferase system IIC component
MTFPFQLIDNLQENFYHKKMELLQSISLVIFFVILGGLIIYLYIRNIHEFYSLQKKDKAAEQEFKKRFATAKPAQAVILGFQAKGFSRFDNGMIKVRLKLDVFRTGFQHSIVYTAWIVRWLEFGNLSSPDSIPIRIDEIKPALIYPDVPWAMLDITEEQPIDQLSK